MKQFTYTILKDEKWKAQVNRSQVLTEIQINTNTVLVLLKFVLLPILCVATMNKILSSVSKDDKKVNTDSKEK